MICGPWKRAKAASPSLEKSPDCVADERAPEGEWPVLAAERLLERTGASHIIEVMRTKVGFPSALFDGGVVPLINAYAEFAQLLPALTPRRGEEAGGLLLYGIEAGLAALDFRRGQILPRGAPPEVIGEQHHRWTYAVLVAALLYGVEQPLSALHVLMRKAGGAPEPWRPFSGTLDAREAASYRWEKGASVAEDGTRGKLALFLFDRIVPTGMIEWLSANAGLIRELLRHLGDEPGAERSALRELAARGAAYAAGTPWPPVPPSAPLVSAPVTSDVAMPEPDAVAEEQFLDPVEEPMPAPRRRKAR